MMREIEGMDRGVMEGVKCQLAASCLNGFLRYMRPKYLMGWVHKLICHELDKFLLKIEEKKSPRLMITMPPRSGKSEIVSRYFPAYLLGKNPDMQIIATSYASELAMRNNRDVQRIIDSVEYKKIFPETTLWGKNVRTVANGTYQRNSDIFEVVNKKGSYRAAGVGGGITGMGGNCLVEGSKVAVLGGEVEIESLGVGDGVLSWCAGRVEVKRILAVRRVMYEGEIVRLCSGGGGTVGVTREHLVWFGGGYERADKVVGGGVVLSLGSKSESVEDRVVRVEREWYRGYVYDIQVEDNENFFAGGVLVHNCLIVDDPIKNREEADSLLMRDKLWDWYTSTLYTRLAPGGGIVLIQTRWHMDDLAGRILEMSKSESGERWQLMSFPAIAESDEKYRKAGEALHPERYGLEQLNLIKMTIGSRDWAAMYQQRPVPDGGQVFKKEWVKYWTVLPESFDRLVSSWDMSFKDGVNSDYVVGQIWGMKGGDYYLIDQIRARMSFTQTLAEFVKFTAKWPEAVEKLVEDRANGAAVIDTLKRRIGGIIPVEPGGGKLARAYAVTPLWEAGNVYIPSVLVVPWVVDFENELLSFPAAAFDDQVDAMTQALNRIVCRRGSGSDMYSTGRRPELLPVWARSMLV